MFTSPEEVDEALDWVQSHTHWLSLRPVAGIGWSIGLHLTRPECSGLPKLFQSPDFTKALEAALDWVITERFSRGMLGRDGRPLLPGRHQ